MIQEELKKKILVLDGAMGTLLASYGGKPCYEILNQTKEDLIQKIHRNYVKAGADIITTNSFSCNNMTLQKYHIEERTYDLARKSAEIARKVKENSGKSIHVFGSVGPCAIKSSGEIERWKESYYEQISGLLDGGVDAFLLETIYDENDALFILNIVESIFQKSQRKIPVFCSMTINREGKLLTGSTITQCIQKIDRSSILVFGLNCSFGIENIVSFLPELIRSSHKYIMIYANAGFPNRKGEYQENIEEMLELLQPFLEKRLIHIIGGCCGTNYDYIRAFSKKISLLART